MAQQLLRWEYPGDFEETEQMERDITQDKPKAESICDIFPEEILDNILNSLERQTFVARDHEGHPHTFANQAWAIYTAENVHDVKNLRLASKQFNRLMAPHFGRILASTAFTLTPRSLKILENISLDERMAEFIDTLTFADGHIRALEIEERAPLHRAHGKEWLERIAQGPTGGSGSKLLQQQRTYLGEEQHESDERVLQLLSKRIASAIEKCNQDQRNLEAAGKILAILTRVFKRFENLRHIHFHGKCDFHHHVPGLTWPLRELNAYLPKNVVAWLLKRDLSFSLRRIDPLTMGPELTEEFSETLKASHKIYKAIVASQIKLQSLICASDAFSETTLGIPLLVRPANHSGFESLQTLYWTPSDDDNHVTTAYMESQMLWEVLAQAKGLKALHLDSIRELEPPPDAEVQATLPSLEVLSIQGQDFHGCGVHLSFLTSFLMPSLQKLCLLNIDLIGNGPGYSTHDWTQLFMHIEKLSQLNLFRLRAFKIYSQYLREEDVRTLSLRMSTTAIAWTSFIGSKKGFLTKIPYPGGMRYSTNRVLKNGEVTFYDVGPCWPTAEGLDKQLDGRRFGCDGEAGEGKSYDDVIQGGNYGVRGAFD